MHVARKRLKPDSNRAKAGIEFTGPQHRAAAERSKIHMLRHNEREIREQLAQLRMEHRDLDTEIAELEASNAADQLLISRLKKRKLKLKDQISALEDRLFPDIIA